MMRHNAPATEAAGAETTGHGAARRSYGTRTNPTGLPLEFERAILFLPTLLPALMMEDVL